jgi:hypothetical protein
MTTTEALLRCRPLKKIGWLLISLCALVNLTGCVATPTNVQVVSANFKPISLSEVTTNTVVTEFGEGTVTFPAGVYQPDFQANEGVFYRAPARIIVVVPLRPTPNDQRKPGDLKSKSIVTGGLVLTKDAIPSDPKTMWYEVRSGGAGRPPRIYPLKNPVPIRAVQ